MGIVRPVIRQITRSVIRPLDVGSGDGASWSSLFLFFGETSKITGGRLYNQISGTTDYMTVTGSGLNTIYETGGIDAVYQTADTDNCWWKINATRSITDGNRLIAYDFARTIVKYDNTSPYVIRWIGILKAGVVPTGDQINKLHQSFELSLWWSSVLNLNGSVKQNRTTARSVWTAESVYEAEITAYLAALVTPLSPTQAGKLNTLAVAIKSALGITHLTDAVDQVLIYGNETAEAGLRNIVQNAYHASLVNAPSFTAFQGFTGNGTSSYINTGYNPYGFPGNYKQDSGTIIYCIKTDVLKNQTHPTHGSQSGTSIRIGVNPNRITNTGGMYVNGSLRVDYANGGSGIGYHVGVRNAATVVLAFKNKTKTTGTSNTSAATVLNGNLFNLVDNLAGTPTGYITEQIAITMVLRGISDTEEGALIDALEAYMDSNGEGVI